MNALRWIGRALAAAAVSGGALLFAQASTTVDLDRLLSQVEANSDRYSANVPSFICDEHIVSQELRDGKIKRETSVDATFSVTHLAAKNDALQESREIRAIDGRPSVGKKMNLPLSFSGGFSGALNKFLSQDHRVCFDYEPAPSTPTAQGVTSFTFVAKPGVAAQPLCASIQPGTRGRFDVETASMQVTHIERTVPNPVGRDQAVFGTAAVDYAAVLFNGMTFWLPTTITAFTTETAKTASVRFVAHYSNYHRFASTSTILSTDK